MRSNFSKKIIIVFLLLFSSMFFSFIPDRIVDLFATGVDSIDGLDTVPRAIDEENFGKLLSLSKPSDKKKIAVSYEIYEKEKSQKNKNIEILPKDTDENYYLLKDGVDIEMLKSLLKNPLIKLVDMGDLEINDELSDKIDRLSYTNSPYLSDSVMEAIVKSIYKKDNISISSAVSTERVKILIRIALDLALFLALLSFSFIILVRTQNEYEIRLRKKLFIKNIECSGVKKFSDEESNNICEDIFSYIEKSEVYPSQVLYFSISSFISIASVLNLAFYDIWITIVALFGVLSYVYYYFRGFRLFRFIIGISLLAILIIGVLKGDSLLAVRGILYYILAILSSYRASGSFEYIRDLLKLNKQIDKILEIENSDKKSIRFTKSSRLNIRNVYYKKNNLLIGPVSIALDKGRLSVLHTDSIIDLGKVIIGEIPIENGEITLNDFDISSIPRNQIYSLISVVDNDHTLIEGSLKKNIIYSNLTGEDTLKQSMKITWIDKLFDMDYQRDKVDFELSSKQSLSIEIARAITRDFEIIVFDRCFDNVDIGYSRSVLNEIRHVFSDRAILLITEKKELATIADRLFEE